MPQSVKAAVQIHLVGSGQNGAAQQQLFISGIRVRVRQGTGTAKHERQAALQLLTEGIVGGIGSKIKIKGLNAGRNNYQAIFAGGITRLVNGTGAMHLKTLLKGYIAQLVESIRDGVAGEIYDYIKTELFGCGEA